MTKVSNRQVLGINAWIKPLKFCLSTLIFAWAIGWYSCYPEQNGELKFINWLISVCLGWEIIYIACRAGNGQLSIFNMSSGFYAAMFSVMAIATTIATLAPVYLGLKFFYPAFSSTARLLLLGHSMGFCGFRDFCFSRFRHGRQLSAYCWGS